MPVISNTCDSGESRDEEVPLVEAFTGDVGAEPPALIEDDAFNGAVGAILDVDVLIFDREERECTDETEGRRPELIPDGGGVPGGAALMGGGGVGALDDAADALAALESTLRL